MISITNINNIYFFIYYLVIVNYIFLFNNLLFFICFMTYIYNYFFIFTNTFLHLFSPNISTFCISFIKLVLNIFILLYNIHSSYLHVVPKYLLTFYFLYFHCIYFYFHSLFLIEAFICVLFFGFIFINQHHFIYVNNFPYL